MSKNAVLRFIGQALAYCIIGIFSLGVLWALGAMVKVFVGLF